LAKIKKLVYTVGTSNLHIRNDKEMAHINLINLKQDKFQDIQDFQDHYVTKRKVCDELDLNFGRCKMT